MKYHFPHMRARLALTLALLMLAACGGEQGFHMCVDSQAFVVFALALAYRVTQDQHCLEAALQTWREIRLHIADAQGGFRAGTNRDFSQTKFGNSQNPVMHLSQDLPTLYQVSGSREAYEGVESIGNFIAYRLLEGLPNGCDMAALHQEAMRIVARMQTE